MGKASHAEGAKHKYLFALALKGTQPGIVDFLSTSAEESTVSGSVVATQVDFKFRVRELRSLCAEYGLRNLLPLFVNTFGKVNH